MGDFKKRGGFGGERRDGFGGGDRGGFRSNTTGGGRGFGNKPRFGRAPHGNRNLGPKEMFSAICAKCNKTCEVPFRPNGEKPVYCNACFGKNSGRDSGSTRTDFTSTSSRFSSSERSSNPVAMSQVDNVQLIDLKRQVSDISGKVDKILELLVSKKDSEIIIADSKVESTDLIEEKVKTKSKSKTKK